MLEQSPAGRAGTPDEVAAVAALLMGPDGGFLAHFTHESKTEDITAALSKYLS